MSLQKEFQTIVVPVLKGLPIIITLVVFAVLGVTRMVIYTVPEYQSTGSIKIDNRNINLGDLALFEETGRTKGATSVDFLTEIEMFKSKNLQELTFRQLDFDLEYFRVGKVKTVELYRNNPLQVSYQIKDKKAKDQFYYLKYLGGDELLWSKNPEAFPADHLIRLQDTIRLDHLQFVLQRNEEVLAQKPFSLRVGDVLAFRIRSMKALVGSINSGSYFVRSVDKEIQIINLYYQHEVAEKAALFLNTLMQTYIDACKQEHQREADKTLAFIEEQVKKTKRQLKEAEGKLVRFKTRKNIINIKQETDATLKEMMQLEFQGVNYSMQKAELERTFSYLSSGNDLRDFAPNFEALKDPLFKEAFLKAQHYELQRQDLLLKYTPQSEVITNIVGKINSMRTFIHESVKNALANLEMRHRQIEKSIAAVDRSIQEFPDKEQQLVILQREVKLNEQLYNSLIEKRMEIAMAKSANTVFHQIIDPAEVSREAVSPNKALFYGVALFFALLLGLGAAYLQHFLLATIRTKGDLGQVVDAPIIGTVPKVRKNDSPLNALGNLYTNLELMQGKKRKKSRANTVLLSSMLPGEGKTFTCIHLAKVYASLQKKVLIIDMNRYHSDLSEQLQVSHQGGLSALLKNEITLQEAVVQTEYHLLDIIPAGNLTGIYAGILFAPQTTSFIDTLKPEYDIILIDAPAIGIVEDVTLMMQQVDYNLLLFRAKKTKIRTAKSAQRRLKEYKIPKVFAVLNATNTRQDKKIINPLSIRRRVWDTITACF